MPPQRIHFKVAVVDSAIRLEYALNELSAVGNVIFFVTSDTGTDAGPGTYTIVYGKA